VLAYPRVARVLARQGGRSTRGGLVAGLGRRRGHGVSGTAPSCAPSRPTRTMTLWRRPRGGAQVLVTATTHLPSMKEYAGVRIVRRRGLPRGASKPESALGPTRRDIEALGSPTSVRTGWTRRAHPRARAGPKAHGRPARPWAFAILARAASGFQGPSHEVVEVRFTLRTGSRTIAHRGRVRSGRDPRRDPPARSRQDGHGDPPGRSSSLASPSSRSPPLLRIVGADSSAPVASASASGVAASPASAVADGAAAVTVTVTLRTATDARSRQDGHPLVEAGARGRDLGGVRPSDASGVVTSRSGPRSRARRRSPPGPGGRRHRGADASATFHPGAADALQSSVAASPDTVVATARRPPTITVTLRDAHANRSPQHRLLASSRGAADSSRRVRTVRRRGVVTFTASSTPGATTFTASTRPTRCPDQTPS